MSTRSFLWLFFLCFFHGHILLGDVNFKYRAIGDRNEVLQYLTNNPQRRVLDIGYSACPWSSKFVTHYVDIKNCGDSTKIAFVGDINFPEVWESLIQYMFHR